MLIILLKHILIYEKVCAVEASFVFSFGLGNNELWDTEDGKLTKDDSQIKVCIFDTLKRNRKVSSNMNIKLMFLIHSED